MLRFASDNRNLLCACVGKCVGDNACPEHDTIEGDATKSTGEYTTEWSRSVLRELRDEIRRADPHRWSYDDDDQTPYQWQYQRSLRLSEPREGAQRTSCEALFCSPVDSVDELKWAVTCDEYPVFYLDFDKAEAAW